MRSERDRDKKVDTKQGKPQALCYAPSFPVYSRLFPDLEWQSASGGPVQVVQELENRRSRLTLATMPVDVMDSLSKEGWVRPLDAWFTSRQLAAYAPQALELATVGGRLYAIPDDITPFVFFIREAVLERLRIDPPRTWDEFGAMAELLVRSGQTLVMLASSERTRLGFLLSLLGSNGVAADSAPALLKESYKAVEAYDWLWTRIIAPGLLTVDALAHPRSGRRELRGHVGGFGWLSDFENMPADQVRRYVFLPFPRGPSLGEGTLPRAPLKSSGWCIPWSKEQPDAAVAVLRSIHARETLRALRIAERRPFLAVRAIWEDPAVQRRYPLYRYAASLVEGVAPMHSSAHAHYRRLDISFRNALLEGLDGNTWMDDYTGSDNVARRGESLPIRTVLRTIESLLGSVRGTGDVARALRIHPISLRRLFEREMGEGITPYFRRCKMEFARKLLQEQGLMTKEVAARTGYRNADAFTRAYGKYWSVQPKVDRKTAAAIRQRTP
jgi:ABC-type glycerol-3-phosphate transport system substrate-binding protein/AraC-like DNA-binding protein